ncbi:MAG: MCE family protein [Gammaproteobacteria bacterium]|nr:MCE family protein [Gammaproteobacteria bacterium]MDH3768812.1 MCE family protein [Gammaproteobacteria bacterium]
MTPKSSYVLVGLFVLILGVALIGGILWLSTGGPPKDYEFYLVYMPESVSGLSLDAPVKYKGVNVGRVRDIRLNPDNPEEVRLLLVVLQGTPVNAETRATLEVQGLTGVANVELSGGGPDSPMLVKPDNEPYPVIQSRPSLLVRLDDTVSELLGNLIETSARVNALLNAENRDAISNTIGNVQSLTAEFADQSQRIETLVTEMSAVVQNTRAATERLPELLGQLERSATAFESMAETLAETGTVLQGAGEDLQHTISVSGQDLRAFTGDTLPEAGTLVSELRLTARNLRRMSESLQGDPSMLLFGPPKPPPGPGE